MVACKYCDVSSIYKRLVLENQNHDLISVCEKIFYQRYFNWFNFLLDNMMLVEKKMQSKNGKGEGKYGENMERCAILDESFGRKS